ncbi:MAG: hypothetical protein AB7G37_00845 [Solirubrobacteraceae bacterium]
MSLSLPQRAVMRVLDDFDRNADEDAIAPTVDTVLHAANRTGTAGRGATRATIGGLAKRCLIWSTPDDRLLLTEAGHARLREGL